MKKILIIEDDKALANGISIALQSQETIVVQCTTILLAKNILINDSFDLIILDINLPDGSGLNLLVELKKSNSSKVILLTANDLETDIVAGLEMGADDYITKPFSLAVLRARVNTQLRNRNNGTANRYRQDSFSFDFNQMIFYKGSELIDLSKTEQKLLWILIENKGIVLERSVLVDRIWTDGMEYVDENALSVTIKRLRDKLEEIPAKPQYIKTVYGIGYLWAVK